MLLELRISHLAIIEAAEIHCGAGFNVLTGETGAGKSIVIDALGLLMGERAAAEQAGRNGNASVEGVFDISQVPAVRKYLQDNELDEDEQLIIARELTAGGRSRVRVNGRLTTAAILREIGARLIDLHGQHESQQLLKPEAHGAFLDAAGDRAHHDLMAKTRDKFRDWRLAKKRLDELTRDEQARVQRLDMLGFQAEEIDGAELQNDEDDALSEERARLMNAEKLREAAALCSNSLSGDDEPGALSLLRAALKAGRELEEFDKNVTGWVDSLQSALYEIEEVAAEAASYANEMEADPQRLEQIESRLHALNRLKRKYGATVEAILAHRDKIGEELRRLSVSEDELSDLRANADKLRGEFDKQANKLSGSRQKLAQEFSRRVVENLATLAMERARFEVHFERDEIGSASGLDRVEFLLSANPGQAPRPLARIASGGEISRVMLALRSVLGDNADENQERVPILIFDEVDTGIGGVTAEAVGEKMQELAHRFQVFCVTHLPQIARRGDHHYRIQKHAGEDDTRVDVTVLDGEARVQELARMMGRESAANLQHARELLGENALQVLAAPNGKKTQAKKA